MQDKLRLVLRGALRLSFRGVIGRISNPGMQRAWMRGVASLTLGARGTLRDAQTLGGVQNEIHRPREGASARALLYLHGGGYTLGSPATHRALASHLASAAQAVVAVPDYRLAPEHPYPAALDDALAVYQALVERYRADSVALAGDSAGGGLALSLALAIRDRGLPPPAGLVLISPWVDLSLSGETLRSLCDADPMLTEHWLRDAGTAYRGTLEARDPRVSPLFANLRNLPPMLVQVGSDEILLSDAERLAQAAQDAGADLRLEVETGLWHDYQMHAGLLRASDAAIGRIAKFLQQAWSARNGAPLRSAA